jgi:hypothetical protein
VHLISSKAWNGKRRAEASEQRQLRPVSPKAGRNSCLKRGVMASTAREFS